MQSITMEGVPMYFSTILVQNIFEESGMTIVDIDGFFWRAEIYPKNKIDLSRPENPRRHLEGVEILEEIFILYQKKFFFCI